MGRVYAGILGMVAFVTVLARGLIAGGGAESTLKFACLVLFGFAAMGWIIGSLAGWIVDESVQANFHKEIESSQTTQTEAE